MILFNYKIGFDSKYNDEVCSGAVTCINVNTNPEDKELVSKIKKMSTDERVEYAYQRWGNRMIDKFGPLNNNIKVADYNDEDIDEDIYEDNTDNNSVGVGSPPAMTQAGTMPVTDNQTPSSDVTVCTTEPTDDGSRENAFKSNDSSIKYFKFENKYLESFSPGDMINAGVTEPVNDYDPIVYHDPPKPFSPCVVKLKNVRNVPGSPDDYAPYAEDIYVDAIMTPIVRLNTMVLERAQIKALTLVFTKFLPEMTFILDTKGKPDMYPTQPGLNNLVQVVIAPSKDGKYKKISLPFYITNVQTSLYSSDVTYTCVLNHMPLIQHLHESLAINYPKCENRFDGDECNHQDSNTPNMWELFHEIAKKCDLGFASMKELREYKDRMPRLISSQNYKKFLEYNLSIGGEDETHIYDGWVNAYGYLTLVDIYKAFNAKVDPGNLAFYPEVGMHTTDTQTQMKKHELTRRVLTNSNATKVYSNLEIEEFYDGSNMAEIHKHGTLNTIYYFCPLGNKGINNLNAKQTRIIENSRDGEYVEDYEIAKYDGWSFVGCENHNISEQMEIRNAYLIKLRNSSQAMTVKLKNPNFALQRGTLVTIIIFSFDHDYKVRLMSQETNLYPDPIPYSHGINPDDTNSTVAGWNNDDFLMNDALGVVMPEHSGIYYIDGMRFDYIQDDKDELGNPHIAQYLYLLRRGPLTGLTNISTPNRLKKDN